MEEEHSSNENTINDWYTHKNKNKISRIMRGRVRKKYVTIFLELNGSEDSSHIHFTKEDFSLLQRNLVFHFHKYKEISKTPSSIHLRRIKSQNSMSNRHNFLQPFFSPPFKLEKCSLRLLILFPRKLPLKTCFTFEF